MSLPGDKEIQLTWDLGSAYDFFLSLMVLHDPETYGLRASWAAGVRSRLPSAERKLLEDVMPFLWFPVRWIHSLPEPKDAATALYTLRQIPPSERMLSLLQTDKLPEIGNRLREVVKKQAWEKSDLEGIKKVLEEHKDTHLVKQLPRILDWWAKPEEFGELYLSALQTYYQSFFEEEERRIAPVLRRAMTRSQRLAQDLSVVDLMAELSQGVHLEIPDDIHEIVFVPGYWNTPLIIFSQLSKGSMSLVFGARPVDMALIPGENVPDGLLRALKALADPTRMQILRFLSEEEMNQAQLARALRLRAPTITHHLSALRLAGLVHVNITKEHEEKRYAARLEAIQSTFANLEYFLAGKTKEKD
jgi:DNA-binding transcriptional ArsR family regulator